MKKLNKLFALLAVLGGIASAQAASHAGAPMTMPMESKKEMPAAAGAMAMGDMADGEIRKVDMDNKKITIKHGEIKNLDMPGMTMVFQVKDPAMLTTVKTGDKVRFKAEKSGGAIVVTEIQPAK
jgi:Cu(I)/Ag(I) efflux system periplasmic protein CusF